MPGSLGGCGEGKLSGRSGPWASEALGSRIKLWAGLASVWTAPLGREGDPESLSKAKLLEGPGVPGLQ